MFWKNFQIHSFQTLQWMDQSVRERERKINLYKLFSGQREREGNPLNEI